MTLNNIIALFQSISDKHYQLEGFGFGNIFEINGGIKVKDKYPLMWAVPLESIGRNQTKERIFLIIIVSLVDHDQSNRDNVWSDTESIADDVIKILREDSNDYELINEPVKFPISEKFSDWVTGWQFEVVIQTDLNSNYCDIPADGLNLNR